ncbi:hypothetical protein ABT340_08830 [Streptosporangium sp. NPDC000239]|uniref:hypothetical protein n=1 Tax=Streptosporangium sp. NPDC000239 TaxID=3154248 RepID=UPI003319D1BD
MRRTTAVLTGAALTALAFPLLMAAPPANALAADPVAALKGRFKAGHGVRIVERAKLVGDGGNPRTVYGRVKGVLEFGPSGVVASDLTSSFELPAEEGTPSEPFAPSRTVTVKGVSYTQGGVYAGSLPEGKKWLRSRDDVLSMTNPAQRLFNPLEPATLRAALAHAGPGRPGGTLDGTRTVVRSGSFTLGELYRISPSARAVLGAKPSAKSAPLKVSWRLYLGADQLPRRAVSSYVQSVRGLTSVDVTYLNDTQYGGWGLRSALKAPPAAEVADFDELRIGDADPGNVSLNNLFTG